jgi:hypothetical protein
VLAAILKNSNTKPAWPEAESSPSTEAGLSCYPGLLDKNTQKG